MSSWVPTTTGESSWPTRAGKLRIGHSVGSRRAERRHDHHVHHLSHGQAGRHHCAAHCGSSSPVSVTWKKGRSVQVFIIFLQNNTILKSMNKPIIAWRQSFSIWYYCVFFLRITILRTITENNWRYLLPRYFNSNWGRKNSKLWKI